MTDNNNKMRAPLFGLICPPALPAGLRLALVALGELGLVDGQKIA